MSARAQEGLQEASLSAAAVRVSCTPQDSPRPNLAHHSWGLRKQQLRLRCTLQPCHPALCPLLPLQLHPCATTTASPPSPHSHPTPQALASLWTCQPCPQQPPLSSTRKLPRPHRLLLRQVRLIRSRPRKQPPLWLAPDPGWPPPMGGTRAETLTTAASESPPVLAWLVFLARKVLLQFAPTHSRQSSWSVVMTGALPLQQQNHTLGNGLKDGCSAGRSAPWPYHTQWHNTPPPFQNPEVKRVY